MSCCCLRRDVCIVCLCLRCQVSTWIGGCGMQLKPLGAWGLATPLTAAMSVQDMVPWEPCEGLAIAPGLKSADDGGKAGPPSRCPGSKQQPMTHCRASLLQQLASSHTPHGGEAHSVSWQGSTQHCCSPHACQCMLLGMWLWGMRMSPSASCCASLGTPEYIAQSQPQAAHEPGP